MAGPNTSQTQIDQRFQEMENNLLTKFGRMLDGHLLDMQEMVAHQRVENHVCLTSAVSSEVTDEKKKQNGENAFSHAFAHINRLHDDIARLSKEVKKMKRGKEGREVSTSEDLKALENKICAKIALISVESQRNEFTLARSINTLLKTTDCIRQRNELLVDEFRLEKALSKQHDDLTFYIKDIVEDVISFHLNQNHRGVRERLEKQLPKLRNDFLGDVKKIVDDAVACQLKRHEEVGKKDKGWSWLSRLSKLLNRKEKKRS